MDDKLVVKTAVKVSTVSIVLNIVLSMLKLLAGIFGKSMAMLSDAIHSLSDVFGSIIVIIGVKVSKKKEDADHPFGHDRLECLASLALGAILFFTGAMLAYEGIDKIYTKAPISTPGKIALFAAIVSIIAKEGMFWYTKINANRINSDALRAEALAPQIRCTFICRKFDWCSRCNVRTKDFRSYYGLRYWLGNHKSCL